MTYYIIMLLIVKRIFDEYRWKSCLAADKIGYFDMHQNKYGMNILVRFI